jgi:hypothetical protein
MKKFEYKKEELHDPYFYPYKDYVDQFNKEGEKGWELLFMIGDYGYYKRQIDIIQEEDD